MHVIKRKSSVKAFFCSRRLKTSRIGLCVPLNNLPFSKSKLERLALIAAIELLAVGQRAAVVDGDGVARLGLARAFYRVRDIDRYFRGESGGCEKGEEEWEMHRGGVDENGKERLG